MDTSKLKRFAQFARRILIEQVSAKLKLVLADGSAARRENPKTVEKLEEEIKKSSRAKVIEKIAYIWFNRFCALRYMDVNRYTRVGIVSPAEGQFQPEILAEAKMGHIDEEIVPEDTRQNIFALLGGAAPSRDPQVEAYRLLVVATCNYYYKAMPYLFERIADYTELLMPDDLLSGNSILAYTREAMTPDVCQDVEVIGWLYQFYISEKKDEVFNNLKKNKKITPENMPAATQLFTPHWIVRYLVENSLGRLWILNNPKSRLIERMDYYIHPAQQETDFLHINKPEELKICDPACGSGHMLVYAFDLLYAIYEEEGYEPAGIPEKILTHNLYGIEIDERAGELAAFALTMKARGKHRRFLSKPVQPNICVLQNVSFDEAMNGYEWTQILDALCSNGMDRDDLIHDLRLFAEANNFGSLLRPRLKSEQIHEAIELLKAYNQTIKAPSFEQQELISKCRMALKQADYLSPKYYVAIANPPYMGSKGMNKLLKVFAQKYYPNSKFDLFSMFIERNHDMVLKQGQVAMITMQSWMFLSSFEKLRTHILNTNTIISMAHLGARAFDSISGEVVSTTAFVIKNARHPEYKGAYLRLTEENSEADKEAGLKKKRITPFLAAAVDFNKIPGSPIAYWVSKNFMNIFSNCKFLNEISDVKSGVMTGDDEYFLKYWYEISLHKIGIGLRGSNQISESKKKWFPLNKETTFRKWSGLYTFVVNLGENGKAFRKYNGYLNYRLRDPQYYFKPGISWSDVAGNKPAFRAQDSGYIFAARAPMIFMNDNLLLAILNSKVTYEVLMSVNPTLTFNLNEINILPIIKPKNIEECQKIDELVKQNIEISKNDSISNETDIGFKKFRLINDKQGTIKYAYEIWRNNVKNACATVHKNEQYINHILLNTYGLQNEISIDVPFNEITLTYNPHYRYGGNKSEEDLETLLLADTMKEFISYSVGCMFGRYSLDKPGLILANQGEDIFDFRRKILNSEEDDPSLDDQSKIKDLRSKITLMPDIDNVIPILDGDWFTDDISERFRKFLRVTFGEENYEENLAFIEKALGKDIRKYFLKDFYNDHVKRYKKRPIYWLFSSPKGSFNALIYMHRYRPDTVSVVLNDYLREFRTKLISRVDHLKRVEAGVDVFQAEKTKALKEIEKLNKMIKELEDYEREVLYPLATEQVEIDLDDGVKINYSKFGDALKKIPGLDS